MSDSAQHLQILIAEDNPMNQMLMKRLLHQLGHNSEVANNGLEALQILNHKSFDVVIMDVQMPELDGIEAIRRIRSNPAIHPSPLIIVLTANHLDKTRISCLDAGADAFLTKPVSTVDLQSAINQRPSKQVLLTKSNLFKRLDELTELGDKSFVIELIELFIQDSLSRMQEINAAFIEQNWANAEKFTHLMKGSAANMGAIEFRDVCNVLHEACIAKNSTMANVALRRAEEEFKRVTEQLNTWKKT